MNISHIKQTMKDSMLSALVYVFRVVPVKQNKVLFISYYGNYYNDNPMMISQQLEGNRAVDCVWALQDHAECPPHIRRVRIASLRYIYELATAKVWVDNCRKNIWTRKRKGQYYIQTWHGNLGNKRTEGAAEDTLSSDYILRAKHDAKMIDLMISGSDFFTNLIRKYFWYKGEILECGTPRLDSFFHTSEESLMQIREKLGIPSECRIVLYAPTFRADLQMNCYKMEFERVLQTLEEKTGDQWVMLVRLHPNVADKADYIQYSSRIINATLYPDLYDLIPLSDVVISDYSSLTFEAGLLMKPVFLFALDLDEYIHERGFYIDIREQPYILAQSNDELVEKIKAFSRGEYEDELNAFNQSLGIRENGDAAKKIVERIMSVIQQPKHEVV